MSIPEHEMSPGNPRCIHCGTLFANHAIKPQPCVPRWSGPDALRPEPARRVYASEDIDAIYLRLKEREIERQNQLVHADGEGGDQS